MALGAQIRSEDGVQTAIGYIYRDLDYARERVKLIKQAHEKGKDAASAAAAIAAGKESEMAE